MLEPSFVHRYQIVLHERVPETLTHVVRIPPNAQKGLVVEVRPDVGNPWVGLFRYGAESLASSSGLFSHPSPSWLCILSGGQVYLVPINDPERAISVGMFPVRGVFAAPRHRLLIFADTHKLTAWGAGGKVWETTPLGWNGLKDIRIQEDFLEGKTWDGKQDVDFRVELHSGKSTGGAQPQTLA
ncbi:MAG: hypothetical protein ACYCW6_25990 [Candidatus Xenobia bacterium]